MYEWIAGMYVCKYINMYTSHTERKPTDATPPIPRNIHSALYHRASVARGVPGWEEKK